MRNGIESHLVSFTYRVNAEDLEWNSCLLLNGDLEPLQHSSDSFSSEAQDASVELKQVSDNVFHIKKLQYLTLLDKKGSLKDSQLPKWVLLGDLC